MVELTNTNVPIWVTWSHIRGHLDNTVKCGSSIRDLFHRVVLNSWSQSLKKRLALVRTIMKWLCHNSSTYHDSLAVVACAKFGIISSIEQRLEQKEISKDFSYDLQEALWEVSQVYWLPEMTTPSNEAWGVFWSVVFEGRIFRVSIFVPQVCKQCCLCCTVKPFTGISGL